MTLIFVVPGGFEPPFPGIPWYPYHNQDFLLDDGTDVFLNIFSIIIFLIYIIFILYFIYCRVETTPFVLIPLLHYPLTSILRVLNVSTIS